MLVKNTSFGPIFSQPLITNHTIEFHTTKRYQEPEDPSGEEGSASSDEEKEEEQRVLGRVLNTAKVMERLFDVDGERILIKFHRESGQIFCKTVEFLPPKATPDDEGEPELTADDVKVLEWVVVPAALVCTNCTYSNTAKYCTSRVLV